MRLGRLDLLKYGHFEDHRLAFPAAEVDFHLILGSNEAGKSTTLAAVTDLLFGFERTTPYSFRFDNALLRVGASVEEGGRAIELRRRKGNAATLEDGAGKSVADAVLAPLLHGMTRETFLRASGLSHKGLREGGEAILAAKDDIGQALFAAGSGLSGVHEVLAAIEAEADGIWAERHSSRRSYYVAEDELAVANKRLKLAEVRPREWGLAQERLGRLEEGQVALGALRAGLETTRRRVQRIRRLGPAIQRRAALLLAIEGWAPCPFDPAAEEVFEAALAALRAAAAEARAAAMETGVLRGRLEALPPESALPQHEDAIDAMVGRAGAARKGEVDLPGLEATLRAQEGAVAALLRDLGWAAAASLGAQQRGLPARTMLDRLRRLAREHAAREERRAALMVARRGNEGAQADCAQGLARQITGAADEALAPAMAGAQRAAALEDAMPARRRAVEKSAAEAKAGLARLAPWRGDAGALAGVAPPGDAAIDAARQAMSEAAGALAEAARDEAAAEEALARLALEQRQLASGQGAVAAEDVAAARARRDLGWVAIRAHVVGAAPLAEAGVAVDGFEAAALAADGVADRRYDAAEASARLAGLVDAIARAELDRDQALGRKRAAEGAVSAAAGAWDAVVAAAGLPAMGPDQARQWRAGREAALQAVSAAADAEALLAADVAAVGAAAARVRAALGAADGSGEAGLAALLLAAEAAQGAARRAATERTKLETRLGAAREGLASSARELEALDADEADGRRRWAEAVAGSALEGLDWVEAEGALGLVAELARAVGSAVEMQQRIGEIGAELRAFEAAVLALAGLCGVLAAGSGQAVAAALREGLRRAQGAASARGEIETSLEQQGQAVEKAAVRTGAAQGRLAPLAADAGTAEAAGMAAALERHRFHRRTADDVRAIEAGLLEDGDGLDLAALLSEAAGADMDALAATEAGLSADIEAIEGRAIAGAQEMGEARRDLAALDRGDEAARAASDAEQARAGMAAEAEAYLLQRAQAVMLRWAIERYRARRQSPMLTRASAHFATLTLGRYSALRIDTDGDAARLIGIRDGESRAVPTAAMSEGTVDQLFLALRLAALEQSLDAGVLVPFLADDLFINFDDARAFAGFTVLGAIARKTQVLFFTHHAHLRAIAERALHPNVVGVSALP